MNNPMPGVPLVESPLFPALLPAFGLTDEEARIGRDLFEHGYAVFDFPDPELFDRIDRIEARLGPDYGVDFSCEDADKTIGERRLQDAWRFDSDVHAIAFNPRVMEIISKLYGRRAFPFQTLNFPVGTQQEAHSDMVHFSSLPEKFMCGVWLAMEDVSPDAGPLFYYPGSHRWPVMSNSLMARRGSGTLLASAQGPFKEAWASLCTALRAEAEVFLARKGQALIWCANLLPGGSPQSDPRLTRWSQVTHYYFDDCLYYTPAFSDEALGALHLRRVVAASDGRERPNMYLGEIVAGSNSGWRRKGFSSLRTAALQRWLAPQNWKWR